jgi:hypothetical protein
MLIRGFSVELVSAKADVAELKEGEDWVGVFKIGQADVNGD